LDRERAERERAGVAEVRELELRRAEEASELLSRAESALKKLGEKTDDKQAVELIDNSPTVIKLLVQAEQLKENMERIRQAFHNPEQHPKYLESEQKLKKLEAQLAAERKRLRLGIVRDRTTDPVSDAEAALKKLRANPTDKHATEALERALKRLKEREKPNMPGEGAPYKR
jgi:hypothetical protein